MITLEADSQGVETSSTPQTESLVETGARTAARLRWVFMPGDAPLEGARDWARALGICSATVLLALLLGWAIQALLYLPNIMLVFLPPVLFSAVRYGFGLALWSSLLSVVLTSLVLAPPLFAFPIPDPSVAWALFFFVLVAGFTSTLASQIREQTEQLHQQNRRTEALYEFSSRLAAQSSVEELLRTTVQYVHDILGRSSIVLASGDLSAVAPSAAGAPSGHAERVRVIERCGLVGELDQHDLMAAQWCWDNGQPAGRGAGTLHGASWLFLPLRTAHGMVGVLGVEQEELGTLLGADESRMLDALASQSATSIERARLATEVQEASLRVEGDRLRSALLTSISHDFRTPLASILGNVTSVITYGELYDRPTRDEMLGVARMETERLSRFVRNLMDMTRLDAGAIGPRTEMVDISDVVGSAINGAERLLTRHELVIDMPAELPMVRLDFVLAEHVLVNLLDNAAKYSPAGSRIHVRARSEGPWLLLSVSDEGPGIPAADLPSIFERFYRAHASDYHGAGVGLGLAICKGFMTAMGGRISAHNCPDRGGANFTVSFPIDAPGHDAAIGAFRGEQQP
jgi:two-component system sensor histidine kinase KdpD